MKGSTITKLSIDQQRWIANEPPVFIHSESNMAKKNGPFIKIFLARNFQVNSDCTVTAQMSPLPPLRPGDPLVQGPHGLSGRSFETSPMYPRELAEVPLG